MIRCSTSLVGVMGAYFFYMEMAVVRFYYEVQKGCFSHWCDKRSVKSFCKKVWFDSTVSHKQGDATVVRFRSREDKKPKRADGLARPYPLSHLRLVGSKASLLHREDRWFESNRRDKMPVSHSGNCSGL